MSDDKPSGGETGISTRAMELAVALILFAIGALVVFDSVRLGASWGDDGPQSGYFPFYIGLLLCISSIATRRRSPSPNGSAATGSAERSRSGSASSSPGGRCGWCSPCCCRPLVYVLGIQLIGIYVASAVYIAVFMRWLGKYPWPKSAAVGVVVSVALFLMFEVWFKVPLYKGIYNPLAWLGY